MIIDRSKYIRKPGYEFVIRKQADTRAAPALTRASKTLDPTSSEHFIPIELRLICIYFIVTMEWSPMLASLGVSCVNCLSCLLMTFGHTNHFGSSSDVCSSG